jgi:hypothetical protein
MCINYADEIIRFILYNYDVYFVVTSVSHQSFPTPEIASLQRLHVYDGLMINATSWHDAHKYHRDRQNIHYQSVYEPGIINGLGVRIVSAPKNAADNCKDGLWVKVQSGLAIDVAGNPIVVDDSADFDRTVVRIVPLKENTGVRTVYLHVSYDEDESQKQKSGRITECFRLDQVFQPAQSHQIELCRIQLQAGSNKLEYPEDILSPGINRLDFRFRIPAKPRPQGVIRIGATFSTPQRICHNLQDLTASIPGLYPALQGVVDGNVGLQDSQVVKNYDLIYLPPEQFLNLDSDEVKSLKSLLETGGVVLVEISTGSGIEFREIQEKIDQQFNRLLTSWQEWNRHILRSQPFLFTTPPRINGELINLWNASGIVVVEGNLSSAWGLEDYLGGKLHLERHEIRTAQEFGVNILHYALRQRQICHCWQ